MQSLGTAWTALVRLRNVEGPDAFEEVLEARKRDHERLSVGALVTQICQFSHD
ncbi:hypothetical protein PF005_g215 [Phytophthora fragariae]|uniref:Uncharacterized protein n=1 Tax=Phytophthora fragariae TaxID=53985 RepID=A0A6A3TPA4_9STRA|nr:hypothetical protein PF003_g8292 [Phytophthora fragariae]KAE9031271.1 hypothetical protein PF011_g222 [Phytophthora fragariae]KAE9141053.1 hypothetical protein PF007_g407 [Phytophthora fragariae]KAE9238430.1 hypothetical protein PF005_g215 [Phytophthora fragariae]KAE9330632.1 hypothetical protein PF001_g303 [Phytophthora fragariae]